MTEDRVPNDVPESECCPCCGDELDLHIGGKPCVGGPVGSQATYAERRAQIVREQERKRKVRLFGEDAI